MLNPIVYAQLYKALEKMAAGDLTTFDPNLEAEIPEVRLPSRTISESANSPFELEVDQANRGIDPNIGQIARGSANKIKLDQRIAEANEAAAANTPAQDTPSNTAISSAILQFIKDNKTPLAIGGGVLGGLGAIAIVKAMSNKKKAKERQV